MKTIYKTTKRVTFREADPAQIMFFGNIFGFAHDAFEEFIIAAGYTWGEWFQTRDFMIPIRHTEADFKIPFFPGQTYDVEVFVVKFGTTSFQMGYRFKQGENLHAEVKMVHTVLDKKTKEKRALPELLVERLTPFS